VSSSAAQRTAFVEGGVRVTAAHAGGFLVHELVFPDRHASFLDPEEGYVAIVLEGRVDKTFPLRTLPFPAGLGVTMPAGASHGSRFGTGSTTVVTVRAAPDESSDCSWTRLLSDVRQLREAHCVAIGLRLAAELRACDDAWTLAAEGLCLELVSGLLRESAPARARRAPPWLESVRERVREHLDERVTLSDLAADAGVHPAYLARSFRRRYGMSVGEYTRRARLSWAAAQLTSTDTPLAALAAEAGFADQSHFTRAFKRHTGLTPARYRAVVR
jgi:AraC family transcriptional regulator